MRVWDSNRINNNQSKGSLSIKIKILTNKLTAEEFHKNKKMITRIP